MNKKLLEILVCPFDKVTSLELLEFQSASDSKIPISGDEKAVSNASDPTGPDPSTLTKRQNDNPIQKETLQQIEIVEEGLLLCKTCQRFYPIVDEIPIILPDELRDKKKDIEFLNKWKERIPVDLLTNLKPWST
ncbi:Trm112 family protein [Candidatus Nitrosocosmicus sp. FF01]|uniref:Trm112 family protein n=1 Tax=Candidatus Nitrosocosmicus sp. FF01 TaxID=3397670 RepID=UPI0039E9165D